MLLIGLLLAPTCFAQSSPLLDILTSELQRNFSVLKEKADPKPYFLAYSVVEQQTEAIAASGGALQNRTRTAGRVLDVSLRLGSPKLDNYHIVGGDRPQFTNASLISLEDNPDQIKRKLWQETDRVFRSGSQRLINLKTRTQVDVTAEDTSDDFSVEEPSVYVEAPRKSAPAGPEWNDRVRKWSAELTHYQGILTGTVTVLQQNETKYFVTSEGTRIQHGRGFARIVISAQGKAYDGMDLSASDTFEAEDLSGLPKDATVMEAVDRVGRDLKALLAAPVVDPFVGPAILSGRASGVFFHEIFGHRIEGHRQRDESEGQTFTKSLNTKVLPDFLSVAFDPTKKSAEGIDLNGTYKYDDEGVKARRVVLVENGVLKTFLMSRSPVKGFANSNGHGRRQSGAEIVSRQSNLIVESSNKVTETRLREMLMEEIKK